MASWESTYRVPNKGKNSRLSHQPSKGDGKPEFQIRNQTRKRGEGPRRSGQAHCRRAKANFHHGGRIAL